MNARPTALDLFCGAGGAAMGLHRAGFDVTGVDIKPQPRYPFRFVQGDALEPPFDLSGFDLIWASPVCKAFTDGAKGLAQRTGKKHPNQIPDTRAMLESSGVPWVIENVPSAPIRADVRLHGHMFPSLRVIRKRHFELSWREMIITPPAPKGLLRSGYICAVGNGAPTGVRRMGLPDATVEDWREALGISWMTRDELSQAIPPAYAEFIGRAALAYIGERAA